jgi:hypothetical protein
MMRGFAAYLRERFRVRVFGPAIVGHAALALWTAAPAPTAISVARALFMAGLLILQFRLWDDLEDRIRDARSHPERVLVRLAPEPFWRALFTLAAMSIGLVATTRASEALIGLLALDLAALAAYRGLRTRVSERAWTHWILLAKYPAFVAIVALAAGPADRRRLAVACLAAFIAAQIYERVHTRAAEPGVIR